jgi:hypothetical protein
MLDRLVGEEWWKLIVEADGRGPCLVFAMEEEEEQYQDSAHVGIF